MTHTRIKLTVAGILLLGAVGYLTFAGVQRGWVYTMGVDQFLASAKQQAGRVRLCGTVSEDRLDVSKAQLAAHFLLKGDKNVIPVAYKGVIPDMFKAGSEVVVEGQMGGAGEFQADLMMTKCASKYEEKPAGHPAVAEAQTTGGRP